MKSLVSVLLLSSAMFPVLNAQSSAITGLWNGTATVKGQQVPIMLEIDGKPDHLQAALRNGPESSPATAAAFKGDHLSLKFNYFARSLDATLVNGELQGTFGNAAASFPIVLKHGPVQTSAADKQAIGGDWEVAVKSAKGESAWQLRVNASAQPVQAVVQRIDGDTGSLFGSWDAAAKTWRFSHFTAAGPALYAFAPQPDGTLLFSNLLNAQQTNLIAHRPAEARKENLPAPTDPTEQTTVNDPAVPFQFSFPDVTGKVISNTDPQFDGKVVIVAIGGSWCPNCHDEAPFLESLYKRYHSRGLEIVNLSFEEADQLKDPTRLHAFIERYGLTYNVLLAGEPDQLNQKITQAKDLNCWPTSFFLGRDGRVKEVHAGFAGPANPPAHEQLKKDVTALVEHLLTEPVPTQNASR